MSQNTKGTRYDVNIISFAMTMRHFGSPWKDVQKEIERSFQVKPTIRQMRNWHNRYSQRASVSTPALFRRLFIERRHTLIPDTAKIVDVLGRTIGQLIELGASTDGEALFLMGTLVFIETMAGDREYFDQIIDAYREWREKLPIGPSREDLERRMSDARLHQEAR